MQPGCSLGQTLQHSLRGEQQPRAGVSPGTSPFPAKSVPATTSRTGPLSLAAEPPWGKKRHLGLHAGLPSQHGCHCALHKPSLGEPAQDCPGHGQGMWVPGQIRVPPGMFQGDTLLHGPGPTATAYG